MFMSTKTKTDWNKFREQIAENVRFLPAALREYSYVVRYGTMDCYGSGVRALTAKVMREAKLDAKYGRVKTLKARHTRNTRERAQITLNALRSLHDRDGFEEAKKVVANWAGRISDKEKRKLVVAVEALVVG